MSYLPEVVSTTDYYAFGAPMPGRQFTSGSAYRYGFNGKENDDEIKGGGNSYDFGARINDPRLGRWFSPDSWAAKYPWQSPYNSMDDNPIAKIDPTGNGVESTHVDEKGKVIKQYDDGDNSVFVHKEGTTASDIDKKKEEIADHSAGGTKIGEIGKTIDVSKIATNILSENKEKAKNFTQVDWLIKVWLGGDWDYKNNKSTIFGAAWEYDLSQTVEEGQPTPHTKFTSEKVNFLDASSFGNFNAGYTGIIAKINPVTQFRWAGLGEIVKFESAKRFKDFFFLENEFGDKKLDYLYNKFGMISAIAEGEKK